jgi:predicted DNA-binding transcriptional regulator AlpA
MRTLPTEATAARVMLADDPIMSPRAAAEYLGFSESWLAKRRSSKHGPNWIRLGAKKIGYRRSALRTWLEQCERERDIP